MAIHTTWPVRGRVRNTHNSPIGTATGWQKFTVTDPVDTAASATFEIPSTFVGPVTFTGANATLQLDDSRALTSTVAGCGSADEIGLGDIGVGPRRTLGYAANNNRQRWGPFSRAGIPRAVRAAGNFVAESDGHGYRRSVPARGFLGETRLIAELHPTPLGRSTGSTTRDNRPSPSLTRDAIPSGRPEHYLQGRSCALTAPAEKGSPAWQTSQLTRAAYSGRPFCVLRIEAITVAQFSFDRAWDPRLNTTPCFDPR
jgi:hypothetical protein